MARNGPKRVVVIGAGLSGLSCATELVRREIETVVLEKSRGLGGRCATWRVDGQPVDYGPGFYHGSDPEFLQALRGVPGATLIDGWPSRVEGDGTPCQPAAFAIGERRLAFAEGMTLFPKSLAANLTVRRQTCVTALAVNGSEVVVHCKDGLTERACAVVLAIPSPQARRLLDTLPSPPSGSDGLMALHSGIAATCCLTLMAGYPPDAGCPPWDLLHPQDSRILQAISHDSTKRTEPIWTALTLQAHAGWSRQWFDREEDEWSRALLNETGRLCGSWAARPTWTRAHRWKYARITGDSLLATPLVLRLPGGAPVGLTGDAFGMTGGAEAAWLAGRQVAVRLLSDTSPA